MRWRRCAVLIGLLALLSGCAAKFLYNNMDWVAMDYLEDYITLDRNQYVLVKSRIEALGEWHRSHELPLYVEHLEQMSSLDPKSIDAEFVLVQSEKIKQHTKRIMAYLGPDLYALTLELSDQQEQELLSNIQKRQKKFSDKYQGLDDEQVRQFYRKKIDENLDRWIGSVSHEQQDIVDRWVQDLHITSDEWFEYQQGIYNETQTLLQRKEDRAYFQPQFRRMLTEPESFYSPELAQKIAMNKQIASQYVMMIAHSMNTKQVDFFRAEVQEWQGLVEELL